MINLPQFYTEQSALHSTAAQTWRKIAGLTFFSDPHIAAYAHSQALLCELNADDDKREAKKFLTVDGR